MSTAQIDLLLWKARRTFDGLISQCAISFSLIYIPLANCSTHSIGQANCPLHHRAEDHVRVLSLPTQHLYLSQPTLASATRA